MLGARNSWAVSLQPQWPLRPLKPSPCISLRRQIRRQRPLRSTLLWPQYAAAAIQKFLLWLVTFQNINLRFWGQVRSQILRWPHQLRSSLRPRPPLSSRSWPITVIGLFFKGCFRDRILLPLIMVSFFYPKKECCSC